MLIRASPWNKRHGWKRFIVSTFVSSALIALVLFLGVFTAFLGGYLAASPTSATLTVVEGSVI